MNQEPEGFKRTKDYARTRRIKKHEKLFKNSKDQEEWKINQEPEWFKRTKDYARTGRIQKHEK